MCFSATALPRGRDHDAVPAVTALSPLLSSHRMVVVFGALALLSFGAAYAFYATWFISVWCFFAALLSAVVYLHFARKVRRWHRPGRAQAHTASRPMT